MDPKLIAKELGDVNDKVRTENESLPNHSSLIQQPTTGEFHSFEKLPREIMRRVTEHTDASSLQNLLVCGGLPRDLWLRNTQGIFIGMQETQFPEFDGLFGQMRGFGKVTTYCTAHHRICIIPLPNVSHIPRTKRRAHPLRHLIRAQNWDPSALQVSDGTRHRAKVQLGTLLQRGGWDFFEFLRRLHEGIFVDDFQALPRAHKVYRPSSVWEERKALLLVQSMHWRIASAYFKGLHNDDDHAMRKLTRLQVKIFKSENDNAVRGLVRQMICVAINRLAYRLGLREIMWDWLRHYVLCTPKQVSTMQSEQQLTHYAKSSVEEYCLDRIFYWGVPSVFRMCRKREENEERKQMIHEMRDEFQDILKGRWVHDLKGMFFREPKMEQARKLADCIWC